MLGNPGSYAHKKRKKPVLKQKKTSEGNDVVKSNPSKRHRDRLNGELDRLTELLPFSEDIRSRLDKLSVLRLSVGYLRVKSYFKATMKNSNSSLMLPGANGQNGNNMDTAGFSEGDLLLQALNGFAVVVTSEGCVFYVSSTIKDYLGFHQSDVVHQSVFELIHTDDRAMFREQLHFALNPPPAGADGDGLQSCGNVMYSPEQLPPENSSFLERSFVCRFRCLLDNSSGFLALKFQGRLKYLHGQRISKDNGTCNKPQLALFAVAVPVQPPAIVEIRAKLLLFQTKHKLDFTPTGIDSRGKVILGYSEIELCMKGSGYQFIHAADMMHCANNHMRMIKTGESGLTVFRLLSKSGSWVWVKSNAKLIYKGGRPEFIIAYQKAIANSEGEEYLRQRRLQLSFNAMTGEGVLYNTGTTVDVAQFQFNKLFGETDAPGDMVPGSLVDSFLKQDEAVYNQAADTPSHLEQLFNESWPLVGPTAPAGAPVVKEEARQSAMSVIEDLEKMAQSGDFCSVLQNLDIGDSELMEWENAVKRLGQDEGQQNSVGSELDSILTNDIFDYIDTLLFKEKEEGCHGSPPSCLTAGGGGGRDQRDPFGQAAPPPAVGEPFETPSPDPAYPPTNGVYARRRDAADVIAGQNFIEPARVFNGAQKLSHRAPLAENALPPTVQQLQLQDIFSPSIELPELTVPDMSAPFQSFEQASLRHMGCPRGAPGPTQSSPLATCPQNNSQAPEMAANGHSPQSVTVKQPSNVTDVLPPLIPCNGFNSPNVPNIPIPFSAACLQGSPPAETHSHQVRQWPQSQQQQKQPPPAGVAQNGHGPMPARHGQTPGGQTFPRAGLLPRSVTGLNRSQLGGLACGQAATPSSCMFDQHSSPSPAGGDILTLSRSLGSRAGGTALDQSPPAGSCYFQWNHSKPVVGTSAINQQNASVSPLSGPPSMSSSEHAFNLQHYPERHRQTQVSMSHSGLDNFGQ